MGRKILRRLLKFLGITAVVIIVIGAVSYLILNKSLPEGQEGPEAEAMTDRMLEAVNAKAWEELKVITWGFPRGHKFVWDRERNFVEVKWKKNRVLVHPGSGKGVAYAKGEKQEGEDAEELITKGRHLFWNDSYWLAGFTKVRDPGTTRKVVDLGEDGKGLLVTYSSGGTTPGDSYLWLFDENGLPKAYQMWVEIIPIGGLEFSFEGWAPLHNGAMLAFNHSSIVFDIPMTDVKSGDDLPSIGVPADLFRELESMGTNPPQGSSGE